ncbi:hypothetical protein ACE6ED_11140 [Paenibacillus sp. CN-4]|uniref:hypothetical protein n=1 Tax=Paenibacillus nanchangensis TaxID=3348343 RepID=UPI003978BDB9
MMQEAAAAPEELVPRPFFYAHTIKGLRIWAMFTAFGGFTDALSSLELLPGDLPFPAKLLAASAAGLLLAARAKAMSAAFRLKSERMSVWR